jgi:regulator of sigma E protease
VLTLVKIIILLGFLVFIHEGGHFCVAKLCKINVKEFSIGFGPKIISKLKNGTNYEIRLIPLGGFVNLEGEEELSDKEGSFSKASTSKKIAIILAGALVNIIFGLITFFILILYRYKAIQDVSFWESFMYALNCSWGLIVETLKGIAGLFTLKLSINDFTGPIGISQMASQTSSFAEFVYLLSIVSISLGVTNLLPIIPLDGGKVVIYIIEAIRKKHISEKTQEIIGAIGFYIIIGLSIIVTFNDIMRITH